MTDADNGFHLRGCLGGRGRIGLSVGANANGKSKEKHGEKSIHGEDLSLGCWASQAERRRENVSRLQPENGRLGEPSLSMALALDRVGMTF
jgi:hypothetical protein